MFNVEKATNDCIQWIRDWREENGPGCNLIVGISGGVDSLVAAELCVEAVGADKVLGVIMPNYKQDDIDVAYDICQHVLNIDYLTTLVAYIPSIGRGHNILKAIANDIGLPEYKTYEELYKALEDEGTVRSIMENDKEIEFKFHARKLEYIASFLKPATAGSDISPFSTKNLPKCDYPIPDEDLAEYNAILDSMDNKDYLLVSRVTDAFLTNKLQKSKQYRTIDLKKDMKKKCLKTKEYIHSLGEWDKYIKYLKENIK